MNTYKRFTSEDVIAGDTQFVSEPMWSNGVGELLPAAGDIDFTATNPRDEYFVNVYNDTPSAAGAEIQYSVAYGHIDGKGSVGISDVMGGSDDTPSKVVYKQFANILLDNNQQKFTINGTQRDQVFFITVARARYKQKIDPGNWILSLGAVGTDYADGSGAGEDPNVNSAGRYYSIYDYDPATGVYNSTEVGIVYPDMGILVLAHDIPGATAPDTSNPSFITPPAAYLGKQNAYNFAKDIKRFQARTEEKITSNYYFVRVTNQQYNYSSNPTFISGSNGEFRWSVMQTHPQVYITTVGLYDDANQLLAVAKLSKPILKNFNREALIKVKIDY